MAIQDLPQHDGVEISTIDRYQGRDKDIILFSCVKCNPSKIAGNLLRQWRRLNVAFTRAKTKLVMVGSRTTLNESAFFHAAFEFLAQHGWIHAVPADLAVGLFPVRHTSQTETCVQ